MRYLVTLISLFFASSVVYGQLDFTATPQNGEGELLKNAWAKVFLDGKEISIEAIGNNGKMNFQLDFNKQYTIEIGEKHHEKMELKVNTKVPTKFGGYTFSYGTSFSMVAKKEGLMPKYTTEPVMHIAFDPNKRTKYGKGSFTMTKKFNPKYTYVPDDRGKKVPPKLPEEGEREQGKDKPVPVEPKDPKDIKDKPIVQDPVTPEDTAKKVAVEPNPQPVDSLENEPKDKPVPVANEADKKPLEQLGMEQRDRAKEAKQLKEALQAENDKAKNEEMRNLLTKAKSKRIFLEEVADSKRSMKQAARGYQP